MTNRKKEVTYENLSKHFYHVFETEEFNSIKSKVIRENLKNLKGVKALADRDDDVTAVADISPANAASIDMYQSMSGGGNKPVSPCMPLTLVQSQVVTSIRANDNIKIEAGSLIESTKYSGEKLDLEKHLMKDYNGNPIEINSRFDFVPLYVYMTRSNIKKDMQKSDRCSSTAKYMKPDKTPYWATGNNFTCWQCPHLRGDACPSTLKIMGIGFDYSKLITLNFKGKFIWETYLGSFKDKNKKHPMGIPLRNFLDQQNPLYKKTLVFEVQYNEGLTAKREPCSWVSIEWRAQRDTHSAIQKIGSYLTEHLMEYHNARKSFIWGTNQEVDLPIGGTGGLPNEEVDDWHDEV